MPDTIIDLQELKKKINKVFDRIGIDVRFTKHFVDRVLDARNNPDITISELGRLFGKEYQKWGTKIAAMSADQEAVLTDLSSDINIPFIMAWDSKNKQLNLVAKTVMRKKEFKTPDPVFVVEDGGILDAPTPTLRSLSRKYGIDIRKMSAILQKGIDTEMEHTTDPLVAREIALDHLGEFSTYYDDLTAMKNKPELLRQSAVHKMWEDFRKNTKFNPMHRMLRAAFAEMSKITKEDLGARHGYFYHATNVKKSFPLDDVRAKDFTDMWKHYRKTGDVKMPDELAELTEAGVGIITKQNSTVDVKAGETKRQAAKFGNKLDKNGRPPEMNKAARLRATPHMLNNMQESTQLNELFDKVADWSWFALDPYYKLASSKQVDLTVEVVRTVVDGNDWEISFVRGDTMKVSGDGREFEVFATVLAIIDDFIETNDPDRLTFRADDTASRIKLYTRLVNRFAASHGFSCQVTQSNDYDTAHYLLRAKR